MIVLAEEDDNRVGFQKSNHRYTFLHWSDGTSGRSTTKFRFIFRSTIRLESQYTAIAPTLFVEWRDED